MLIGIAWSGGGWASLPLAGLGLGRLSLLGQGWISQVNRRLDDEGVRDGPDNQAHATWQGSADRQTSWLNRTRLGSGDKTTSWRPRDMHRMEEMSQILGLFFSPMVVVYCFFLRF